MTAQGKSGKKKRIVYEPLPREVLNDFAQRVCTVLGEQNPSYAEPEVASGFARFLEVTAEILAKNLNKEPREKEDNVDNKGE